MVLDSSPYGAENYEREINEDQSDAHWPWPKFGRGQWVATNNDYGYGCACMELRVNKETHEVSEIKSSRALPLSKCRRDRALKRWADRLD